MTEPQLPTADAIRAAARRIAPYIARTRTLRSDRFDAQVGARVVFKCEHEQVTEAFKYRGATNAVQSLPDNQATRGVATHSSGNHGQALAKAAKLRGIPCYVVMPHNSVGVKLEAVRALGATVRLCEPTMVARAAGLAEVVAATGATPVHPFEDPRVIAGQGTAALELLDEHPGIDTLITPVGGGGLISGTAIAGHDRNPKVAIVGAEPAGARDAFDSLRTGTRVTDHTPDTICDGLRGTLGAINFDILRRHEVDLVLVDDAQVRSAMQTAREVLGVIIEPSAATVVAALLAHPDRFRDRTVGAILSGGNLDR